MNLDGDSKKRFLTASNVLIAVTIAAMLLGAIKTPSVLLFPGKQALIDMGAGYGLLTLTGDYWRVVTCLFLHIGLIHLSFNMYGLSCVGPTAESLFGRRMFVLIYFFSGIVGSLTSIWHDPLAVSAGASGAILGVFGSLLAFMYLQRDKYPRQTLWYYTGLAAGLLVATIAFGIIEPGTDNFAHIGGFVAGVVAGLVLGKKDVNYGVRLAYALPIMVLMLGVWTWAIHNKFVERGFESYAAGTRALRDNHLGNAIANFTQFISHDQSEPNAYGLRAIAYLKQGQLDRAVRDYDKMIALSPDTAGAYNDRAWAECGLGLYDRAVADATLSLKFDRRSSATYDTRGYALAHLGKVQEALADFTNGLMFSPKETACHYHRMKVYESMGMISQANADKQQASGYRPEAWER